MKAYKPQTKTQAKQGILPEAILDIDLVVEQKDRLLNPFKQ
jgi:hypothetical protein